MNAKDLKNLFTSNFATMQAGDGCVDINISEVHAVRLHKACYGKTDWVELMSRRTDSALHIGVRTGAHSANFLPVAVAPRIISKYLAELRSEAQAALERLQMKLNTLEQLMKQDNFDVDWHVVDNLKSANGYASTAIPSRAPESLPARERAEPKPPNIRLSGAPDKKSSKQT